jgi:hypothetical protein
MVHTTEFGIKRDYLIVAQPNGKVALISEEHGIQIVDHEPNSNESIQIATEITSPLNALCQNSASPLIGMVTLDGNMKLVKAMEPYQKWSFSPHQELFAISKFSLLQDSGEEWIAACAWNGHTYLVDPEGNLTFFAFNQRVCAFTAGQFSIEQGRNEICLMYVTFDSKVHICYDLGLKRSQGLMCHLLPFILKVRRFKTSG